MEQLKYWKDKMKKYSIDRSNQSIYMAGGHWAYGMDEWMEWLK